MKSIFLAIIISAANTQAQVAGLGPGSRAETEIRLYTASTVYTDIFSKIGPAFEKQTGIELKYVNDITKISPPATIMRAVVEGKAEAGASAIGFTDWVKQAEKDGVPKEKTSQVTYRLIGTDLIRVTTHPTANISKLTLEQIEEIFSGKVKNWQQVGGANLPIVLLRQSNSGARDAAFRKFAMHDVEFATGIKEVTVTSDLVEMVRKTPGSVSFLPDKVVNGLAGVNLPQTYEIGRPINLITIGKPSPNVLKLIDFIRESKAQK